MTERFLCVVLHDVAPATWPACQRLLDALGAIGDFPVTLLAVPRYHGEPRDAGFERWLCERAALGDEVALHGYTHLDAGRPSGGLDFIRRRFYTRGEGEFWDLPFAQAKERLEAGTEWLRSLGLAPVGFVAPAWLMGAQAWEALRCQTFDYTCTLRRLYLLPELRSVVCQGQVYSHSSAWRRAMSLVWNESLSRLQTGQRIVRLELHPSDVDYPALRRSWQRLARRQVRSRHACTLRVVINELKTGPVLSAR